MSGHTALVLGDQLSHDNPVLAGAERVLIVESIAALTRLRYHRRRRHLVLSAMRHFAQELRDKGVAVEERRLAPSIGAVLRSGDFGEVRCAAPNSGPSRAALAKLGIKFVASGQFLTEAENFAAWADEQRGRLVMEPFYRRQRTRFGLLLREDGGPEGGQWNYDKLNRRPVTQGLHAPPPWMPREDNIDAEVRRDLDALALPEWGEDGPREWPATAAEARTALHDFVEHRLANFGPWQDAMVPGEPYLYHSRLSAAFNLWLLDPLEACRAAEAAYRDGTAPLQSVEGFIRQVIGWREYVWGMYWYRLEAWRDDNALDAHRPLPEVFWTGDTDANCLARTVGDVRERAYAHHIQRLMILGNWLLLLGVEPWEAVEWFQAAFIDGAEWVMAPNAVGMATWGDGGVMMTKPYVASGNYVQRTSTYCQDCRFDPKQRTGPDACPVTALYWDFLDRHAERFAGNHRMRGQLLGLQRMDADLRSQLRERAERVRSSLEETSNG